MGLIKLDSRSSLGGIGARDGGSDVVGAAEFGAADADGTPPDSLVSPSKARRVLKLAAVAWNFPSALVNARLATVVGEAEPPPLPFEPAEDRLLGDEFSAAAITAATASTSMPGTAAGAMGKDRPGACVIQKELSTCS